MSCLPASPAAFTALLTSSGTGMIDCVSGVIVLGSGIHPVHGSPSVG